MSSTGEPKSDYPRPHPRDEADESERAKHPAEPKKHPADPELADIEDLREAEKRKNG